MVDRQDSRRALHGLLIVIAAASSLAACAHQAQEAKPVVTSAQVQAPTPTFTFAPPAGTHFVRTETRSFESSIAGTPIRRSTEDEFQWVVDVSRSADGYTIHQDLARVTFKTYDKTVADALLTKGTIALDLITDQDGNLSDIHGIDRASQLLVAMVAPEDREAAADAFSPASLRSMVYRRYQATVGNLVGRPASVGASWTLPGDPSQRILSRKVTVEGTEICGTRMCDRIRADVELDTGAVTRAANDLVKGFVRSQGGDASQIKVTRASDAIGGVLVVDPSTLLSLRASLDERARVTVGGRSGSLEFNMHQSTRLRNDYGGTAPQAMISP